MLQKWIASVVALCMLFSFMTQDRIIVSAEESTRESADQSEDQPDLAPEAESAVLMDMDTGTVLFEKNSEKALPPASITKIMSMLIIMEAIEKGELAWNDEVRTSERAASMGGSQIFLEEGEVMSVEDLMKGIAIASGNDATVALAEHIAGTEENFVQLMNERAQEIGLQNTHFVNTNGLPADGHESSAKDIALMSRELLKHEEVTRFTQVYEDYLREDSDDPFWLVNTNRMVKFYEGMDGLKTGYTNEAKYCLAATAKRDDMRLVAVVMGTSSPKERNAHIAGMMDYAFSQYETHPIYQEGDVLQQVTVDKGEITQADLVVPHQISVLTKKGGSIEDYTTVIEPKENLEAPVEQGDTIGQIQIEKEGKTEVTVDMTATEDIPRASWWTLWKRIATSLFDVTV